MNTTLNISNTSNTTESLVEDEETDDILVIFGPSNPYFDMIHYTALASLGLSIIISTYTLIYLIRTGKGNFNHWKMGQYKFYFNVILYFVKRSAHVILSNISM